MPIPKSLVRILTVLMMPLLVDPTGAHIRPSPHKPAFQTDDLFHAQAVIQTTWGSTRINRVRLGRKEAGALFGKGFSKLQVQKILRPMEQKLNYALVRYEYGGNFGQVHPKMIKGEWTTM